jgi:hypothetical protein
VGWASAASGWDDRRSVAGLNLSVLESEPTNAFDWSFAEGLPGERLLVRLLGPPTAAPGEDRAFAQGLSPAPAAAPNDGEVLSFCGSGLLGRVCGPLGAVLHPGGETGANLALRACCSLWLPPRDGLLLHAASLEGPEGRALLLCGRSGAGKTTLARRLASRGLRTVGDEVATLRAGRLWGHPFWRRVGDGTAPAEGLPLSVLAFVEQAPEGQGPRAERLSQAVAARQILRRTFLAVRSPRLLSDVLLAAERLAALVPAFVLRVPGDERAADCVLALARSGGPRGVDRMRERLSP